nr:MAG TPA: hypothetical protein [Caudoviricetes sp.]
MKKQKKSKHDNFGECVFTPMQNPLTTGIHVFNYKGFHLDFQGGKFIS